jgi:hypothetical protein
MGIPFTRLRAGSVGLCARLALLAAASCLAACTISTGPATWVDPNLRVTHPNGDGPQVVRWGPPDTPAAPESFPH